MTDTLHYPDTFATIQVPESDHHIALTAKRLFDVAVCAQYWNQGPDQHFTKLTDTVSASQAFWHHEDNTEQRRNTLVLSMLRQGMILAIEHPGPGESDVTIRRSLAIGGGISRVYTTDPRNYGRVPMGSETVEDREIFEGKFFETIATLGLQQHVTSLRGIQDVYSESRSAIFAKAS